MRTDAELWLIIICSWVTIITICYQCLNLDSQENEMKKKEIRKAKEMELQKRK